MRKFDEDSCACFQTNFDTKLRYDKLDLWIKFSGFEVRIANQILAARCRDCLHIGFNGLKSAGDTDRVANPLGENVNFGWFQRMPLNALQNVIDSDAQPNRITYGAAGDYKTLDALVVAMIYELIDAWHQNGTGLVCLIGPNLLQDKYVPLVNA
jgi:Phage major capsid protein, P2 family